MYYPLVDSILRAAARSLGLKRFFTGEPCRNGHVAERATNNGACLACVKEAKERFADRNGRQFRRNHGEPERKAAQADGLLRYSTGSPCRNGHLAERYTSTGKCVVCEGEKQKRYYDRDPVHRYAQTLASRRRNRQPTRDATKRWQKKNPERHQLIARASHQARRARSLEAEGTVTTEDFAFLFEKQKGKCAYCGKKAKKMEIDHIHPLLTHRSHRRKNLQLLCRLCNRRKGAKDPISFAQELGLLL